MNPGSLGAPLTFYVTRHALSCNNIVSNLNDKQSDPALTDYGIEKSIEIGKKLNLQIQTFTTPRVVFVSCLLRTWLTAAFLWGQFPGGVRIVVSPFLKEYDRGRFDVGNLPENFFVQLKRFYTLLDDYNKSGNGMIEATVEMFSKTPTERVDRFTKDDLATIDAKSQQRINMYDRAFTTYNPQGIQMFCTSYNPEVYGMENSQITVVAHSHIMQACSELLDRPGYEQHKVMFEQNSWTLVIQREVGNHLKVIGYIEGAVKDKTKRPNIQCQGRKTFLQRSFSLPQMPRLFTARAAPSPVSNPMHTEDVESNNAPPVSQGPKPSFLGNATTRMKKFFGFSGGKAKTRRKRRRATKRRR